MHRPAPHPGRRARRAPPAAVNSRPVTALAIRLRLGIPWARIDLRRLAAYRDDLDPEQFTTLLTQATSDIGQAQTIISLLDQLDASAPQEQHDLAEEERPPPDTSRPLDLPWTTR